MFPADSNSNDVILCPFLNPEFAFYVLVCSCTVLRYDCGPVLTPGNLNLNRPEYGSLLYVCVSVCVS